MTPSEVVQTIFAGIGIVWLPIQILLSYRQAQKTSELGHRVQRLNAELDQSVQRLYRVRDLNNTIATELHSMFGMALGDGFEKWETAQRVASSSGFLVSHAELKGLVKVIGNTALMDLVHEKLDTALPSGNFVEFSDQQLLVTIQNIMNVCTEIHAVVYKMLEDALKVK